MSSHSVDPGTQKAASASSQATDAALAAQANQNTQFAQQTRNALFGTPNASGQMTGGSLSAMTNPGSLLFSGLTGPYNSQYQQSADITNKQDQNQLATQRQSQANRGFSKTPSGFDADQELQTRLAAAGANGSNYATLAGKQYQDTLNNFWNANNLMAGQSASANSSAIAANSAAASNYANLYGTASQQKQNPWLSALSGVSSLATGVGGLMGGINAGSCWVAAELYGGWYRPETIAIRGWFQKHPILCAIYRAVGPWWAQVIHRHTGLRAMTKMVFNRILERAVNGDSSAA